MDKIGFKLHMVYCNLQNYPVKQEWDEADTLDPLFSLLLLYDMAFATHSPREGVYKVQYEAFYGDEKLNKKPWK